MSKERIAMLAKTAVLFIALLNQLLLVFARKRGRIGTVIQHPAHHRIRPVGMVGQSCKRVTLTAGANVR